jgi:hypothetical protein
MLGLFAFLASFLLLSYGERFYLRTRRPSLGESRIAVRDYTVHFLAASAVMGVLVFCLTR